MSITNTPFPVLIFVRGLPGSGKSYVTNRLQKELGEGVVVLDPDATDYDSKEYHEHTKVLTEQDVNPALFAYRFLREKAYKAIEENKVVIWNQPFTNLEIFNKMIANLRIKADEHQVGQHDAHQRQQMRGARSQVGAGRFQAPQAEDEQGHQPDQEHRHRGHGLARDHPGRGLALLLAGGQEHRHKGAQSGSVGDT